MKKTTKLVKLQNPLNLDVWLCYNYNEVKEIDGVEYIEVFKEDNQDRKHLIRKNALKKIRATKNRK